LFTGVTVREGIKKDGKVVGVKTSEGDEIYADVVIAADGVNSFWANSLGLIGRMEPDEVALGVKEVLALPREKIEDRFNLERGEGTTIEMFGDNTQGMLGYSPSFTQTKNPFPSAWARNSPIFKKRASGRRICWNTPRTTP
jgi:electron transfer flavoprotein-quinone oxidoreductase